MSATVAVLLITSFCVLLHQFSPNFLISLAESMIVPRHGERHRVQEEWTWKLLSTSPHNGLPSFIPTIFIMLTAQYGEMETLFNVDMEHSYNSSEFYGKF